MDGLLTAGAIGASVPVLVHGGVGHRWMRQQLRDLPASPLFGDADVGRRVFAVTWHAVTALFGVTAVALWAAAVGAYESREVLLLVAALYASVMAVALVCFARRLDAVRRPVPPVFFACTGTVVVTTLLRAG